MSTRITKRKSGSFYRKLNKIKENLRNESIFKVEEVQESSKSAVNVFHCDATHGAVCSSNVDMNSVETHINELDNTENILGEYQYAINAFDEKIADDDIEKSTPGILIVRILMLFLHEMSSF